jgi:hypothetical protein
MDKTDLKLECLKIAADECRFNGADKKKLVERAAELAQFVLSAPISGNVGRVESERS